MGNRKPKGYWENWENVEEELLEVIEELGDFPTSKQLRDMGNSSLAHAASKYHGSLREIKVEMGFNVSNKPSKYWTLWENVEKELRNVIEELGHFPTQNELKDLGYSSLILAIPRFNGTNEVRKRMGFDKIKNDRGYWKEWENVETEIKKIIKDNNLENFPTQKFLSKNGYGGLINGIAYFGGFYEVSRKCGIKHSQDRERDYWNDWDNVKSALEDITEDTGHLPTESELKSMGYGALVRAIQKHYGGTNNVRIKMGYPLNESPKGYWKNWDNLERELKEVIDEIGHFPTQKELKDIKRIDINGGIRHYGGMLAVREKMGIKELKRMPNGYWKDINNLLAEGRKFIEENSEFGDIPFHSTLVRLGYGSLSHAIVHHGGGYQSFRQKLREYMGQTSESQLEGLLETYVGGSE